MISTCYDHSLIRFTATLCRVTRCSVDSHALNQGRRYSSVFGDLLSRILHLDFGEQPFYEVG